MKKWVTLFRCVIFSFAIYMWFLGSSLVVKIDGKSRKEVLRKPSENHKDNLTYHIKNYCAANIAKNDYEKATENSTAAQKILREARMEKAVRDVLVYIPELQQLWCLVPKAASTSWSRQIIETLNLKFETDLKNGSVPQIFLRKHYGNIGTKALKELESSTSVKKIVLTRHPFSRLISAYEDKLKNRTAKRDSMFFYSHFGVKINRAFRKDRTNKRKEPTFEEFVEYLLHTDPIEFDEHWKPISLLCGVCKVQYNHIIKQEDLGNSSIMAFHLDKLKLYGHGKEIKRDNVTPREFAKIGDYFKNFTKAQVNLLYRRYEDDFNLFSYDLDFLRG